MAWRAPSRPPARRSCRPHGMRCGRVPMSRRRYRTRPSCALPRCRRVSRRLTGRHCRRPIGKVLHRWMQGRLHERPRRWHMATNHRSRAGTWKRGLKSRRLRSPSRLRRLRHRRQRQRSHHHLRPRHRTSPRLSGTPSSAIRRGVRRSPNLSPIQTARRPPKTVLPHRRRSPPSLCRRTRPHLSARRHTLPRLWQRQRGRCPRSAQSRYRIRADGRTCGCSHSKAGHGSAGGRAGALQGAAAC